jgi:hypothetical protein
MCVKKADEKEEKLNQRRTITKPKYAQRRGREGLATTKRAVGRGQVLPQQLQYEAKPSELYICFFFLEIRRFTVFCLR